MIPKYENIYAKFYWNSKHSSALIVFLRLKCRMEGKIKSIFEKIRSPQNSKNTSASASTLEPNQRSPRCRDQRNQKRVVAKNISKKRKHQAYQEASSASISKDDFANLHGNSMDMLATSDGYKVYTEEMLDKMLSNSGGDTPLCPFDCKCCF